MSQKKNIFVRSIDYLKTRVAVRSYIIGISIFATLLGFGISGYQILSKFKDRLVADQWTILFMETQERGEGVLKNLKEAIEPYQNWAAEKYNKESPNLIVFFDKEIIPIRNRMGTLPDKKRLMKIVESETPNQLIRVNGKIYWTHTYVDQYKKRQSFTGSFTDQDGNKVEGEVLVKKALYMAFFELELAKLVKESFAEKERKDLDHFLISKEGDLIYSSDLKINEVNIIAKPVVQGYIRSPLRKGHMEVEDSELGTLYGLFRQLPETNLVLFSQIPKSNVMAVYYDFVLQFLVICLLSIIGVVALMHITIGQVMNPIQKISKLAASVANGNFNVRYQGIAVGELATLKDSFNSMNENLLKRDSRIAKLMEEKAEKARLEAEVKVAQSIQENLLPKEPIDSRSSLRVGAIYEPAEECAGDWYHYHYDEKTKESVVIICDVSGHGTGSAMFTGIIASIYEQTKLKQTEFFDVESFLNEANTSVRLCGNSRWSATLVVLVHREGEEFARMTFAGHNPPLELLEDGKKPKKMKVPSDIIGIRNESKFSYKEFPVKKDSAILLYTDGIVESENPKGKMYGNRRLAEQCKNMMVIDPEIFVNQLLQDCRSFRAGNPADDDICLICIQVK